MQPIHIFRAGSHVASSGQALDFSEADLVATAAAYNPSIHEAPIVAGHPRHDAPAYGWVKSLSVGADGLSADPAQVDAAFAELVQAGRFKKVSASFFAPDSKLNPVPGVWYLRHVGFLGAQPPAVKGLRQAEFAEAEEGVITVEFGEMSPWTFKQFFQGLRDWFLVNHGQDTADKVVPSYLAEEMDMAARREEGEDQQKLVGASVPQSPLFSEFAETSAKKGQAGTDTGTAVRAEIARLRKAGMSLGDISAALSAQSANASRDESTLSAIVSGEIANPPESLLQALRRIRSVDFSEPNHEEDQPMSEADKARLAELEAENATLKTQAEHVKKQSAEFSEREQKLAQQEAAARRADIDTFVGDQIKAGRVLPAEQAGLTAFMESVAAEDVVEFGEGDGKVSKPAADWLRGFVAGLPARVDFSERARGNGNDTGTASFSAPGGYSVDGAALDTHARAKALQATNPNLSFIDAVKAAEKDQA